ncbi:mechanosensitive ion channel family protein [Parabacteroides sp. ZJ-118]|uniref:mechanosensitive ion channel family protein n=1 Tax=Parabacteroides sp. ZJ-118 TaxID=2709398 RepID=UPI0013EBB6D5|nr:mechanosensitive ion channel domain-containing protein [Parabacteroides sp. ZJ-118]
MVLLAAVEASSRLEEAIRSLIEQGSQLGFTIVKALLVFLVGRLVINLLNKLVRKILSKRDIDPSVKTFAGSLVNVSLTILLIISVVGALGVQTASFAALLASAGVAVGMALSGNLSNFAGGLIILLFKPYKVGDYIEAQGVGGIVKEVQMFHTVLDTLDNKAVYIPNGALSSGVVTNFSNRPTRRVDWTFGVRYGSDYEQVKQVIASVLAKDARVLSEPAAPFIALTSLADGSVSVVVRAWVNSPDYWDVYFDTNKHIYEAFNAAGIECSFPQLIVRQA